MVTDRFVWSVARLPRLGLSVAVPPLVAARLDHRAVEVRPDELLDRAGEPAEARFGKSTPIQTRAASTSSSLVYPLIFSAPAFHVWT